MFQSKVSISNSGCDIKNPFRYGRFNTMCSGIVNVRRRSKVLMICRPAENPADASDGVVGLKALLFMAFALTHRADVHE